MMAAFTAASRGRAVFLLERNKRVGIKLSITGKGRCNITTTFPIEEIIDNIPGNGSFLYSSLNRFTNWDLYDFFESGGLKLKEERGGRVFPQSNMAGDVVAFLRETIRESGVKVFTATRVKELKIKNDTVAGVKTFSGSFYPASSVLIATGGLTYPQTGSTGDGYEIAGKAGHTIISPRPSLVGIRCREKWPSVVSGLALKNVNVTLRDKSGDIDSLFGELLFTDFGLSGPVILTLSRKVGELLLKKYKNLEISLDLKPALSPEKLDRRIQRDFSDNSTKIFKNSLSGLFPGKLISVMIELSGIDPQKIVNQITQKERQRFVKLIKDLSLRIEGLDKPEQAVITAGGINVKEINPKTMESKLIKGLFFAGEVIDVDGFTGGFNLQIAFSTGKVAGLFL